MLLNDLIKKENQKDQDSTEKIIEEIHKKMANNEDFLEIRERKILYKDILENDSQIQYLMNHNSKLKIRIKFDYLFQFIFTYLRKQIEWYPK